MTTYRVEDDGEDINVFVEDGGVACIRAVDADGYATVIDLYQGRITEGTDPDKMREELGEGKMYCEESTLPYTDPQHIQTALKWLVVGETEFKVDEYIWEGF